jgi:hypothetical protein
MYNGKGQISYLLTDVCGQMVLGIRESDCHKVVRCGVV